MAGKLTKLQARFVEEYMLDQNSTQAAGRAGSKAKDLSVAGCELLANPNVKQALTELTIDRSERLKINADWLLSRLAEEAQADVADIYAADGNLKPVHEWPKIWRQGLVAGITTSETSVDGVKMGEVVGVKISDRIRRLELIGKHINVNAFQDTVQHKGLDALADRLARASKRVE